MHHLYRLLISLPSSREYCPMASWNLSPSMPFFHCSLITFSLRMRQEGLVCCRVAASRCEQWQKTQKLVQKPTALRKGLLQPILSINYGMQSHQQNKHKHHQIHKRRHYSLQTLYRPIDLFSGSNTSSRTSEEKRSLRSSSSSLFSVEGDFSKVPSMRVFQSFLRQAMKKMTSMRERQVTSEKGMLKGQIAYRPIHSAVERTKVIFPQTVYTPPQRELLFSSQTRRQDRVTPGTMTSTTTSQEHFLKRPLIRSGTWKNKGEDNSVAQSLQDLGRMKCSVMAMAVTVKTQMNMETKACLRVLKYSTLMDPTQMQTARMSQSIQFQKKKAMVMMTAVQRKDTTSHTLITPASALRRSFKKQKHSLKQMNTKKEETATPTYRSTLKALEKSLTTSAYNPISKITDKRLKTAKAIQVSCSFSGCDFHQIDHTWECMATPIITAALMAERMRQPNSKGLWRLSGSQLSRKLTWQALGRKRETLLQQLELVMGVGQLKARVREEGAKERAGLGQSLGYWVTQVLVASRVGKPEQASTILSPLVLLMISRLPLLQLVCSLQMVSLQISFRFPEEYTTNSPAVSTIPASAMLISTPAPCPTTATIQSTINNLIIMHSHPPITSPSWPISTTRGCTCWGIA